MIKEDYISFKTAKLLKERGFDADSDHDMWYVVEEFSTGYHWNSCTYKVGDITREYDEKYCIAMPTLQMVMKWMREEKNILISVNPTVDKDGFVCFVYYIWDIDDIEKKAITSGLYSIEGYNECVEEAIKYCLKNFI